MRRGGDMGRSRWLGPARPPPGAVSWPSLALYAAVLASPLLLGAGTARDHAASEVMRVLPCVAVLAAGFLLRIEHRVTGRTASWWLSVTLMALSGQTLLVSLASWGEAAGHLAWSDPVGAALVSCTVVGLLVAAEHLARPPWADAFAAALVVGAVLALVRLRRTGPWAPFGGPLEMPPAVHVGAAAAATVAVAVVLVARMTSLPSWFRWWLLTGGAILTASELGASAVPLAPVWVLVGGVAGATLVLAASLSLLQVELQATFVGLRMSTHRAATAEAAERAARAQLHDLTASVSSIASAAQLLATADAGPLARRRLAVLLDAEMSRLDRLLSPRQVEPAMTVRLSEVLAPLVRVHRQLGHLVMWAGEDPVVGASPDDLSRIVVGLLSNAHRHAPGSPVCITSAVLGDQAEVRVSDRGPGVDRSVRARLFAWEARREGSPGEGIGLHIARDLARGLGGDLTYQDGRRGGGATFVLTVPLAPDESGVTAMSSDHPGLAS